MAQQNERVHGGVAEAEADALIDFSVNLNTYGPCHPVMEAARAALLGRYPDPSARAARTAWAHALDQPVERIAVGHGAAELIWTITRALLAPGERVVIAEPTFSELRVSAQACGGQVERLFAQAPGLQLDLELLTERACGARLVYLCSPNNPTGEGIAAAAIARLAERLGTTWLVLDQSFLSLSDLAHEALAPLPDNVIVVRSLTKDFALPGLRIGYLLGAPAVVERIERARPTWATSAPALAAIACAATQQPFVRESWQRMRADRERLKVGLTQLGLAPLPGVAAYVLVPVDDAAQVTSQLKQRGLFVRDASSFGLPGHVRVASRPEADTLQLLEAWARIR